MIDCAEATCAGALARKGEPGRALPYGHHRTRRRKLVETHPGVQIRRWTARRDAAGHHHQLGAGEEGLLMQANLTVRRYNPDESPPRTWDQDYVPGGSGHLHSPGRPDTDSGRDRRHSGAALRLSRLDMRLVRHACKRPGKARLQDAHSGAGPSGRATAHRANGQSWGYQGPGRRHRHLLQPDQAGRAVPET